MTVDEFTQKFFGSQRKLETLNHEIVEQVRALIPVLKDHNLENVAKAFEEKLFLIDAIDQEMQQYSLDNPDALIQMLRRMGDQKRQRE